MNRDLQLLNEVIDYLIVLWRINGTNEEIINKFKTLGFTEEDLDRLEIKNILEED